jgi:hypothetical protein
VLGLAADLLARGERVLVVDGGRRLRLHRTFGAQARLGFRECLAGELPVLGVVQTTGVPGLFLLARGASARAPAWIQLDRVLEEARPHFGHVVLAIEPSAPAEVGSILAGRVMDGSWGAPRKGWPRGAMRLADRIGIRLFRMDLALLGDVSLEAMKSRSSMVSEWGRALDETPIPAESPAPGPVPSVEPVVLGCELRVWERLRFLIWMRRVQAESRREILEPLTRSLEPAPH